MKSHVNWCLAAARRAVKRPKFYTFYIHLSLLYTDSLLVVFPSCRKEVAKRNSLLPGDIQLGQWFNSEYPESKMTAHCIIGQYKLFSTVSVALFFSFSSTSHNDRGVLFRAVVRGIRCAVLLVFTWTSRHGHGRPQQVERSQRAWRSWDMVTGRKKDKECLWRSSVIQVTVSCRV